MTGAPVAVGRNHGQFAGAPPGTDKLRCAGPPARAVLPPVENFDPRQSFAEDTAAVYDDDVRGDEAETVACLHELARGGPALELAIGTGRIGLPLAVRGIRVDGVEQSTAMIARLRAKPGGDQIAMTVGDMAEVAVHDSYRLVFLVYNTLYNLLTQDDQVRCFENVARHLTDDGVFSPIVTRYVWPSELDLMARIAGLHLQDRWSGWNREPFDRLSTRHVSVYGRHQRERATLPH